MTDKGIDIDIYINKFATILDKIVEDNPSHDFKAAPIYSLDEFKQNVMGEFQELFKTSKRYLVAFEIFNYLLLYTLKDTRQDICLIDFLVYFSKIDSRIFHNLPNEVVEGIKKKEKFTKLQEVLSNEGRMDYEFDDDLFVQRLDRKRRRRRQVNSVSLEDLTHAIFGRRTSKRVMQKKAEEKQPENDDITVVSAIKLQKAKKPKKHKPIVQDHKKSSNSKSLKLQKSKTPENESEPEEPSSSDSSDTPTGTQNKRTRRPKQEISTLKSLYEDFKFGVSNQPQLKTQEKLERLYKPPYYEAFVKYGESSPLDERERVDRYIHDFATQAYKKFNQPSFDPILFLHEREYQYIIDNLSLFGTERLPKFKFSANCLIDDQGYHPTMYTSSLKKLKIFDSTDDYLSIFGDLLPESEVDDRVEFLNNLITDGVSLFRYKKMAKLMHHINTRTELAISKVKKASTQTNVSTADLEKEYREDSNTNGKPEVSPDSAQPGKPDDIGTDKETSTENAEPTAISQLEDSTQSSTTETKDNADPDEPDEIDTGDSGIPEIKEIELNYSMFTANRDDFQKMISMKEFTQGLASIISPEYDLSKKTEVTTEIRKSLANTYATRYAIFRPYLIDIFIQNLDPLFSQSSYFRFNTLIMELALKSLRDSRLKSELIKQKNAAKKKNKLIVVEPVKVIEIANESALTTEADTGPAVSATTMATTATTTVTQS